MLGFEVYDIKTFERMLDRFMKTDDGELWKQDSHGNWVPVPQRMEYLIIPYNKDGHGEIW